MRQGVPDEVAPVVKLNDKPNKNNGVDLTIRSRGSSVAETHCKFNCHFLPGPFEDKKFENMSNMPATSLRLAFSTGFKFV